MATFYSEPAEVIRRTGIQPADLGFPVDESDPDDALDTFLTALLTEVADLIDRRIGRSYLDESTIPPGLVGIAADVASDSVRTMVATRQTPVVRIDDFAVTVLRARVFSADVRDRLRLYGNRGIGAVTLTSMSSLDEEDDLI